jgi:hypothetical protein
LKPKVRGNKALLAWIGLPASLKREGARASALLFDGYPAPSFRVQRSRVAEVEDDYGTNPTPRISCSCVHSSYRTAGQIEDANKPL